MNKKLASVVTAILLAFISHVIVSTYVPAFSGVRVINYGSNAAPTTTSTSITTTTSTSTVTTTSSSSSTVTTTSSTTSTTATSFEDPKWVVLTLHEDTTPLSGVVDASVSGNNIDADTSCTSGEILQDTTNKHQGTSSTSITVASGCYLECNNGTGCNESAFEFTGSTDKFTVIFWGRSALLSGVYRLQGTALNAAAVGGWRIYADGDEVICLSTDNGVDADTAVCGTSAFLLNTEFVYSVTWDASTTTGVISINGIQEGSNSAMVIPTTGSNYKHMQYWKGSFDNIGVYAGKITAKWQRKLLVCGPDLSLCTCGANPILYSNAPKHVDYGGFIGSAGINTDLPPCNDLAIATE